jgi:hypothetical protein
LLICYRYESIGEIQHELGIKLLSDYTRNQFYEYIFHLRVV